MANKNKSINVKFFETYTVKDEHRNDPDLATVFKAGKTYPMDPPSAAHFLRKSVCIDPDEVIAEEARQEKADAEEKAAKKARSAARHGEKK